MSPRIAGDNSPVIGSMAPSSIAVAANLYRFNPLSFICPFIGIFQLLIVWNGPGSRISGLPIATMNELSIIKPVHWMKKMISRE
jgi:hypothetical protein